MARTRKDGTGADAAVPVEDVEPQPEPAEAGEDAPEPSAELDAPPEAIAETAAAAEPEQPSAPGPRQETGREPPPSARRGGFLAPLLGGVVAAGLGFGAAAYVLPRVWPPQLPTAELAAVRDGLARHTAQLDTLTKSLEAMAADPAAAELAAAQAASSKKTEAELADLRDSLATLDARSGDTAARLDTVEARLTALEKRPVGGGAASATALDAFGREMEALRTEMAGQKAALADAQARVKAEADAATATMRAAVAEADRLREEAEASARRTTARAALSRIEAALSAGGALDPALADLRGAGVEVPAALAEQGQGVPTLDALRRAFPPAARDALAASLRETASGSLWQRTLAFLRTQSGARSLAPREGADPDAVLSRAEAALAAGDLGAAIADIGALPADGQARMAEWVALAKRRIAATNAAAALAAELK